MPVHWQEKGLTLDDWKDFLKVTLDLYVRESNFTQLDDELKNWIGSRFSSKFVRNPTQKIPKIIRTDAGHKFVMAIYPIV